MKTRFTLFAAIALLASSAFADIRSYHGGFSIGTGGHEGHHRHHAHRGHHHSRGHHHRFGGHRHNHGYLSLGYGSIFHPAYFASNYSAPAYALEERAVVIHERVPKPPRVLTYAPHWTSGSWKTHAWYRSRPEVIAVPDTLRDSRSAAQLRQIYGEQASAAAR
jgi:hypothetical protein